MGTTSTHKFVLNVTMKTSAVNLRTKHKMIKMRMKERRKMKGFVREEKKMKMKRGTM
jgi:hypothetical protein